MNVFPRRQLLAAVLACSLWPVRALGAGLQAFTAEESRALRAAVQAQLNAFASGNAAAAYGMASTAIQQQFGDAERFMAMVRSAYPMVVNPSAVAFRLPERVGADTTQAIQPVQLRDREGKNWLATYQLEAQPGGAWRIAGCIVVADSQRMST